MPVRIYTTNAGTDLSDAESALLADLIARHGRAVLLAPTFAELDLCRHDAAEAGISLGIDYKTPASWLRSLWELLGDGRGFVDNLQRQMLFSDMIARRDDAEPAAVGDRCGQLAVGNPGHAALEDGIFDPQKATKL